MGKTAEFFNGYASRFDRMVNNPSVIDVVVRRSMILRHKMALDGCFPTEGRSILDVGCGSGIYTVELAERGAKYVLGLDFSKGMICMARARAAQQAVEDRCKFVLCDFSQPPLSKTTIFDYSVVMGVMDYVDKESSGVFINNVLKHTSSRAFFSFPKKGGLLAWQREVRYKLKCPLFLYTQPQIEALFREFSGVKLVDIGREFFVSVSGKHGVPLAGI